MDMEDDRQDSETPVVCVRCWKYISDCQCINIEDYEE